MVFLLPFTTEIAEATGALLAVAFFILASPGIAPYFKQSFNTVFSWIPGFGPWVSGKLDTLVDQVTAWEKTYALGKVKPFADLLVRVATRMRALTHWVLTNAQVTYNALYHVIVILMPAAELRGKLYTEQLHNDAVSQATALQQAAVAQEQKDVGAVAGSVQAVREEVRQGRIDDRAADAQADAQQLSLAEAYTDTQVRAAEAQAATEVDDLALTVRQGRIDDRAAAQTALADAVAQDQAALSAQQLQVQALIAQVNQTQVQQFAQTETELAGLGAIVTAGLNGIRAMRCLQQCDVLGQLGDDLQILDLGLLLALLLGMAKDPKAGAQTFASMLGAGPAGAAQELGNLFTAP